MQDLIPGHGGLPRLRTDHGHALPVHGMASEVVFDPTRLLRRHTGDDAEIDFLRLPVGELFGKTLMGGVRFGGHEAATGVPVEAVHNAGAPDPADPRELTAAMMEQRIDQRAIRVPGSRMHHQALRLVEDDQCGIFIKHPERDILSDDVGHGRRGNLDHHRIARGESLTGFAHRASRHRDMTFPDEVLETGTGQIRPDFREVTIEPHPRRRRGNQTVPPFPGWQCKKRLLGIVGIALRKVCVEVGHDSAGRTVLS